MDNRFDLRLVQSIISDVVRVNRVFYRTQEINDHGFDNTNVYIAFSEPSDVQEVLHVVQDELVKAFEGTEYRVESESCSFIRDGSDAVGMKFTIHTQSDFDPNLADEVNFNQEVFRAAIANDNTGRTD